MVQATMTCKRCNNTWEYSGLSASSAYCPHCSTLNQIPENSDGEVSYGPLFFKNPDQ